MPEPYSENQYGHNPFDQPNPPQNPNQNFYQYPPQIQQPNYYAAPQNVQQKSKVVAALLAFFLGTWGLHNFYLGYNRRGIAQLVTWIIAFSTSFLIIGFFIYPVLAVWVFIEFVLILIGAGPYATDSNGIPLN